MELGLKLWLELICWSVVVSPDRNILQLGYKRGPQHFDVVWFWESWDDKSFVSRFKCSLFCLPDPCGDGGTLLLIQLGLGSMITFTRSYPAALKSMLTGVVDSTWIVATQVDPLATLTPSSLQDKTTDIATSLVAQDTDGSTTLLNKKLFYLEKAIA
ncbi:unnamed protein product [Dovyalis caffra]|uniref:Uncharacterized protein n=1 Tax=Dovyalis caffra TaxID=77055 RepID=A0AAV1R5Y3_9ROSI|nr:unnamed protein product [Dovyalis caffra]